MRGEWIEAEEVEVDFFMYGETGRGGAPGRYHLRSGYGRYHTQGRSGSLSGGVRLSGPEVEISTSELSWERDENGEIRIVSQHGTTVKHGMITARSAGFEILLKEKKFRLLPPNQGIIRVKVIGR